MISGGVRGRAVTTMTPPLNVRHGNRPLTSPASSPNLSTRSVVSAPPTIRIDNSAPEFPTKKDSTTDLTNVQQKVLQLPPVNTWVPKGESLFNSILDSRSPQIYRRTSPSISKPASSAQSTGSQSSIQSSRVSWPQRSQSYQPQLSPPVSRHSEKEPEQKDIDKSPKLLRKCTSFDLERSKPFPARSMMSSPMLLKKGTSVDEGENSSAQFPSPKLSKWGASTTLELDTDVIIHREEEEFSSEVHPSDIGESVTPKKSQSASGVIETNGAFEFDAAKINESLEDPSIPETAILNDIVSECNRMAEQNIDKSISAVKSDNTERSKVTEPFSFGSSPELGAKPKVKKHSTSSDSSGKKFVKTKTGQLKQKTKDLKTTSAAKCEHGVKRTGKDAETQDKGKGKTSSSTVKTALLSSAAKIKAISRKSPVTLLSYKSHSISVPDQSDRPERPFSTSDVDRESKARDSGIHQTESSPTVLLGEEGEELGQQEPVAVTSAKSDIKKSRQSKTEGKKNIRPCESPGGKNVSHSVEKKTDLKSKAVKKSLDDKLVKSSSVAKTVDKQSVKSIAGAKASTSSKSQLETPEAQGGKKKVESRAKSAKKDTQSKDIKPKSRLATKRDSISSVNSDSSKKSDHFHDCCHVRRKPADKK